MPGYCFTRKEKTMKTSKKNALTTAAALIGAGIFISLGALFAMKFDFNKMNTLNIVTNTYTIDEAFTDIFVKGAECDILLRPSQDNKCSVICRDGDKISHSVTVKNNTLTIQRTDNRKWYECIGIYWGRMEIIVYLPQTEYKALDIASVSGSIDIPDNFSFTEAKVSNTSGSVNFSAPVSGNLSVKTVSGSIKLDNIKCKNVTSKSTSGRIALSDVTASDHMNIETVSGGIRLTKCDAGSLWLKSVSGNITGSLLNQKTFVANTVSGSINVPASAAGGRCEIKTTSGNISFEIEKP